MYSVVPMGDSVLRSVCLRQIWRMAIVEKRSRKFYEGVIENGGVVWHRSRVTFSASDSVGKKVFILYNMKGS